eukprot:6200095-Pleurochrysis_carterae.AAC.1
MAAAMAVLGDLLHDTQCAAGGEVSARNPSFGQVQLARHACGEGRHHINGAWPGAVGGQAAHAGRGSGAEPRGPGEGALRQRPGVSAPRGTHHPQPWPRRRRAGCRRQGMERAGRASPRQAGREGGARRRLPLRQHPCSGPIIALAHGAGASGAAGPVAAAAHAAARAGTATATAGAGVALGGGAGGGEAVWAHGPPGP